MGRILRADYLHPDLSLLARVRLPIEVELPPGHALILHPSEARVLATALVREAFREDGRGQSILDAFLEHADTLEDERPR